MAGTTLGSSGVTFPDGSVQGSAAGFATGTAMLFKQTAAPTGWTKDVTNNNDAALRVVTGAAGTGGTANFSTAFASRTPSGSLSSTTATNQATTATGSNSSTTVTGSAGATTLAESQIPSHRHFTGNNSESGTWARYGLNGAAWVSIRNANANGSGYDTNTSYTGGSGSHSHSLAINAHSHTLTMDAHNHTQDAHSHTFTGSAMDFAVKYVDVIIATKN